MGSAISVSGLIKRYGEKVVLDDVDLQVGRRSVCALLGPNGAGRTTAVRVLTTLTRPDGGRVEVAGVDVVRHPRAVRRRIGTSGTPSVRRSPAGPRCCSPRSTWKKPSSSPTTCACWTAAGSSPGGRRAS